MRRPDLTSFGVVVLMLCALSVCWRAPVFAKDSFSIEGCVVDGSGKPAPNVKVLALQVGSVNVGKAVTNAPDGCYRILRLAPGNYLMSLRDERFVPDHIGPVQAEVHVGEAAQDNVNLRTDAPDERALQAAISNALHAASAGYQTEEQLDDMMDPSRSDNMSAVPAKILPGFSQCAIHFGDEGHGPTAAEWCRSAGMKEESEAVALFQRIEGAINAAVAVTPDLLFAKLNIGGPMCEECRREIWWGSPMNGAISLRLLSFHGTTFTQLWLTYNRWLAEEVCTSKWSRKEEAADLLVYQTESVAIAVITDATVRMQTAAAAQSGSPVLSAGRRGGSKPRPERRFDFPAWKKGMSCSGPMQRNSPRGNSDSSK